jgi:hypothetical protein
VRQRLLESAVEEARRPRRRRVAAARQLVPVQPRALTRGLGTAALLAAGLVWMAHARGGAEDVTAEPSARADESRRDLAGGGPAGMSDARKRWLGTALFHAPARVLASSDIPDASASLLPERPFSDASRAWQVRRWDDLSTEPLESAPHEFVRGDLCVTLAQSQRVLGAWPWAPTGAPAPADLALAAGRPYRVVFRAWAREPLPAQLLVAVGHARAPFSAAAGARVPVSSEPRWFAVDFVPSHDDPSAGIAFLATADDETDLTRVCVGDVMLIERR